MLTTYCRLMHYENGITIPNMVGAYYIYDKSIDISSYQCITRILNDILVNKQNPSVLINKCGHIKNYILSLLKTSHTQQPNLKNKIFINVYDPHLRTSIVSEDKLGETLYSIYREEIINERFSFKDGSWQQFTELETNHINNIINSLRK